MPQQGLRNESVSEKSSNAAVVTTVCDRPGTWLELTAEIEI